MGLVTRLDVLMAERKVKLGDLAERVGITQANLSILKNGRARAIRFSTLEALCRVLDCQPGDLFRFDPGTADGTGKDEPRAPEDSGA